MNVGALLSSLFRSPLARNAAFAFAACAALASCSPEEVPRTKHDAAEPIVYAPVGDPASNSKVEEIYGRFEGEIKEAQEAEASARRLARRGVAGAAVGGGSLSAPNGPLRSIEALKERIQAVGLGYVLNANYVKDPAYSVLPRMLDLLRYFNAMVLELHRRAPDALAAMPGDPKAPNETLLDTYVRAARDGCNAELQRCNPTSARYYSSDLATSRIIQIKASEIGRKIDAAAASTAEEVRERLQLVGRYYSLLRLAHALSIGVPDRHWELAYLKHARDYAAYAEAFVPQPRRADLIQMHGRQFDRLLQTYEPDPSDPEFAEFVRSFKPWSRSQMEADSFPWGTDRMFSFAARFMLYARGPGPSRTCGLDPTLHDAVQEAKTRADQYGPGFADQVRELRLNADAAKRQAGDVDILSGLRVNDLDKLEDPCFYDEYFYVVDRLYRGHLNVEEATQVWLSSKRDEGKFLSTANLYMKVQVLRMVLETNKYMRSFYDRQQFNSENLVKRVILESKDLSDRWANVLRRFEDLALFMDRQAKVGASTRKEFDDAMVIRDSIKRNIKYFSVYPNMMMLAYFMSDTGAKLKIQTWFWEVVIEADTVIDALLNGNLTPWFNFGTDRSPINKIEMLYSFYYALSAGAFETFSVARDAEGQPAVSRKRFFKQVMKKYLSPPMISVENMLTNLREKGGQNLDTVRMACANLSQGNENFTVSVNWADAVNTLVAGGGESGASLAAQEYFRLGGNGFDTIFGAETERDSAGALESRLAPVRVMAELVEQNMRRFGRSQSEIDDVMGEIRAFLKRARDVEESYYRFAFQKHREFGPCLDMLGKLERRRTLEAMAQEGEHLGAVYDALVKLEDSGLAPEGKEEQGKALAASFGFTEGYDAILPGQYKFTQADFMLRHGRRMRQMTPAVRIEFEPLVQRMGWSKSALLQLRDPQTGRVKSREEFVNEGLRSVSGRSDTFTYWLANGAKIDGRLARIRFLAKLFKAGVELGMPETERVSAGEVLDEVGRLKSDVEIAPEEMELMKRMGLQQRVPIESLNNNLLFHKTNGEPLGLGEIAFKTVLDHSTPRAEAERFAKAMITMGYFLIDPGPEIERLTRAQYRPMVLRADQSEILFEQAVRERESRPQAQEIQPFVYALSPSGAPLTFEAPRAGDGSLQLLRGTVRRDFKAVIDNFHVEKTARYFRTLKPGDQECLEAETMPAPCVPEASARGAGR